jgi:predicted nucleic acid-binding protein
MAAFRAVLDTNVVVAAHRSESPTSPNRDLLRRWRAGEFALLFSDDVLLEYIEKLTEFVADEAVLRRFVRSMLTLAESVKIETFHLRRYPADVDDIGILLCAINGHATHLVSYDGGFAPFIGEFGFAICEPLAFLEELRRSRVS